jgi:hypothetical protein
MFINQAEGGNWGREWRLTQFTPASVLGLNCQPVLDAMINQ